MWGNHFQNVSSQFAGNPHFCDFFSGFNNYAHQRG
jgi:hypothetical protein